MTVLDPITDTTQEELARFAKLHEFPGFVKKAALDTTTRPVGVGAATYADPRTQRYPCHTAAATWLSGLYFHEKQAEYHPKDRERIQQRLEHYVDFFRIRPAYEKMAADVARMQKEAELPDSSYAYVWADPDSGHKSRHLPMRSGQEVKAAAEWLEEYRDRMPFP